MCHAALSSREAFSRSSSIGALLDATAAEKRQDLETA
jgi:hypothetical protein